MLTKHYQMIRKDNFMIKPVLQMGINLLALKTKIFSMLLGVVSEAKIQGKGWVSNPSFKTYSDLKEQKNLGKINPSSSTSISNLMKLSMESKR